MEFQRINDNTVRCIITSEDLDEQGIRFEDFIERKQEALDFLHEIVERATEEVDYHPRGGYSPMQISILSDNTISLTMSEDPEGAFEELLKTVTKTLGIKIPKEVLEEIGDMNSGDERLKRLQEYVENVNQFTGIMKQMKEVMQKSSDLLKKLPQKGKEKGDGAPGGQGGSNGPAQAEDGAEVAALNSARKSRIAHDPERARGLAKLEYESNIFIFQNIHDLIEYSLCLPAPIRCQSALYKNPADGLYYLELLRGNESTPRFAQFFVLAMEYGQYCSTTENGALHMHETMECLLADHALNRLKKIGKA